MVSLLRLGMLMAMCHCALGGFASFLLLKPSLYDIYTILPPNTHASIAVEYTIQGASFGDTKMCLEVTYSRSNGADEVYIAQSCMDAQHTAFTLDNLIPGSYTLIMHIQEGGIDMLMSQVRRPFEVRDIVSSLPTIFAQDVTAVADRHTNKSDVSISFSVSPSGLSHLLTACISVVNEHAQHLLSSCIEPSSKSIPTSFTLFGLPVGTYTQSITVALRNSPFTQYESTSITHRITVLSLLDALPAIACVSITEAALPRGHHTTDVSIPYQLSHKDAYVMSHLQLCYEVAGVKSCVPASTAAVLLPRISEGNHTYTLSLQLRDDDSSRRNCSGNVRVEVMSDFLPSYSWQEVHAWQSIPPGLLTRLPMSGDSVKEARIPEPWQLHTSLPSSCKGYFLRMDVRRDTTMKPLREQLLKMCAVEEKCIHLWVKDGLDAQEALDNDTMEMLDVFNRKLAIVLDEPCLA